MLLKLQRKHYILYISLYHITHLHLKETQDLDYPTTMIHLYIALKITSATP